MKKKNEGDGQVIVTKMEQAFCNLFLVGRSPLIINRLAEKARHELLMPKGKKTAADKAGSLKHDVYREFRSSAYTISDENAPTYLAIPSAAPKRAMASAALDMPGAKKAQIGRLAYVDGEMLNVYGAPQLLMSVTRSADMARTPDIRTRCIVPNWAIKLRINFVTPILKVETVVNLLTAAGLYIGIGDWRSEKGSGNYGQFNVLEASTKTELLLKSILDQGREVQIEGMRNPVGYDDITKQQMAWYEDEIKRRGHKTQDSENNDSEVTEVTTNELLDVA